MKKLLISALMVGSLLTPALAMAEKITVDTSDPAQMAQFYAAQSEGRAKKNADYLVRNLESIQRSKTSSAELKSLAGTLIPELKKLSAAIK